MYFFTMIVIAASATLSIAAPSEERAACTCTKMKAAMRQELKTIASHSAADAAKIPLDPLATRSFFLTPNEVNPVTVLINAGVTAEGVRDELVLLATALDAGVEDPRLFCNPNGTATSDFVQTDRIALPLVQVRELHTFNENCEMKTIIGWVHGPLTAVTAGLLAPET